LFVLFMFLVFLYCFNQVLISYQVPHQKILSFAVIANPIIWVEATSTMDYFVALGFVWLGFLLLLKGRWWGAGLSMALGVGSRATSILAVGFILLFLFITHHEMRKLLVGTALLTLFFSAVLYLPSWTFRFLRPSVGSGELWTPYLRIGRWIYKNIYFWGIPVWIIFIFGFWKGWKERVTWWKSQKRSLLLFCLLGIFVYESLFIIIPANPSYLIPTIPLWLILMGYLLEKHHIALCMIVSFLFISNFVTLNIARPNIKNHASSAQYGVWLEPGHLIVQTQKRLRYVACGQQICPEDILPTPEVKKKKK
jgi:hypothetical protein